MGFSLDLSIPVFTVFLQGLLSFFSPCVLPLVPLYIGYLSGGTQTVLPDGTVQYTRKTVLRNTLFFIVGVCFAFFLLGIGMTALGQFFSSNQLMFARVGGILVVLFGLYQLGWFGASPLDQEHRFHLNLQNVAINPLTALAMGFTFSFAWTPCVGPALTTVLLMASSASTQTWGFVLIGVYTLGFVLPFLAVGVFTTQLLTWFQKHRNWLQYTVKIGGVLMILMGIMMFTGHMNGITGYLSAFDGATTITQEQVAESEIPSTEDTPDANTSANTAPSTADEPSAEQESAEYEPIPVYDFTLLDQFGNEHTLSAYQGKTVFLNFWATWCSPCTSEMPYIQQLYEEYGENTQDVVIIGVSMPKTEENPYTSEGDIAYVTSFLQDNGYTYPVLMDVTGEMHQTYGISAVPTTFMIDANGNLYGYLSGSMTKEIMQEIIRQTVDSLAE